MSEASRPETLPQFLRANAIRLGHRRPAYRYKDRGIWRTTTWSEAWGRVERLALGLASLGFGRGDKLGVISDNRPEAFWGILAAQGLRGTIVPVYQDGTPAEVRHVLAHSDARVILAEDQEQVDKLLEVRGDLPALERIITIDPKGLRQYRDPVLVSLAEVEAKGEEQVRAAPDRFAEAVASGGGDDSALISYTSGSTGVPKGVVLTHRNLLAAARGYLSREVCRETDNVLSYLPLAWIGETAWSLAAALVAGFTVNCPERPETVLENLREVGPQIFLAPPRIWENFLSSIEVRIEDAGWVKRRLYRSLVPVGMEVARRRLEGQRIPGRLRLLALLGEWLVFGPVRDHLGLGRVRYAYTGGAGLGPEVFLLFRGLGINLKQIYGQTEIAAFGCCHPDSQVKPETVGPPFPGLELAIGEGNEIRFRGPSVFAGYYKAPDLTAETVRDGWLHTGDGGLLEPDGHLVVIDRVKDIGKLLDGSPFAPQFVENKLKFSPYVREAVAVGRDRPYVAALLNIDLATVGTWAERRNIPYTSYADLAQKAEVYALIQEEVRRINRTLPAGNRVERFLILHKELDPDDGEVTRTRKVRRAIVTEKYRSLIEALYGHAEAVPVVTTVTYEDGRQAESRSELRIQRVGRDAETL